MTIGLVYQQMLEEMRNQYTWKQCPFCRSKNDPGTASTLPSIRLYLREIVVPLCTFHAVCCETCGASGPPKVSREDAVKAWNSRA